MKEIIVSNRATLQPTTLVKTEPLQRNVSRLVSNILIHLFPIIYKNDYFFVMKYLVKISWFYMSNLFRNLLLLCCYALYFRVNPHSSSKGFLDIQATIECGFTLKQYVTWVNPHNFPHKLLLTKFQRFVKLLQMVN